MGVNKQIIVGNLGKDPEVRTAQDGYKTGRFTVAVTDKGYTLKNGTQVPDHTEWFNIYVSGNIAGVAEQYLHKGDRVYIEGKTYTGEYTDKQGQQRRYTEVRCDVLEMLTTKAEAQQNNVQQQAYAPQQQSFVPQQQAYIPQQQAYAPAPAPQQYAQPVQQAYVPQQQAVAPQQQAVAPQQGVFGQPAQVPTTEGGCPF